MYFSVLPPKDNLFAGPNNAFDHHTRFRSAKVASASNALATRYLTVPCLVLRNLWNCLELMVTVSADAMRCLGAGSVKTSAKWLVGTQSRSGRHVDGTRNCLPLLGCSLGTVPTELSSLRFLSVVNKYSRSYKIRFSR
jgi:hypothetical protein